MVDIPVLDGGSAFWATDAISSRIVAHFSAKSKRPRTSSVMIGTVLPLSVLDSVGDSVGDLAVMAAVDSAEDPEVAVVSKVKELECSYR
jgi:hypothetical protein